MYLFNRNNYLFLIIVIHHYTVKNGSSLGLYYGTHVIYNIYIYIYINGIAYKQGIANIDMDLSPIIFADDNSFILNS